MQTYHKRITAVCMSLFIIQLTLAVGLWKPEAVAETLRVARSGGPAGLGNPFTSVAQPSSGVWSLIFDGLTVFDKTGTLQPGLAVSWRSVSETTWEFQLRPNVQFHNGQPATASAVAEAINLVLIEEARSYYIYPNIQFLESVDVIDDLTLEFKTNAPDPILPQRLSLLMIVEPGAWRDLGPTAFSRAPVGTGPYRLKDWGRGNARIVLEAFTRSWRPAQDVSGVEMIVMPDPVARSQALLSGVVDMVEVASRSFEMEERTDLVSFQNPTSQVYMLVYRLVGNTDSPLLDRRVREALSYTVNRQAIADIIYEGDVQPANQPVTPEITGFNESLPDIPYDLERAKTLLAEAGYAGGFSLDAEFVNGSTEEALQMLQLIAQDMARVGVTLNLQASTIQTFFSKWQSGDWGNTDMFLAISDGSVFFDAARPLYVLSCDKPSPFVCNETLTQRLRTVESDMNLSRRTEALQALVGDVVRDYPAIWLATMSNRVLATKRIGGLPMRPLGIAFEHIKLR